MTMQFPISFKRMMLVRKFEFSVLGTRLIYICFPQLSTELEFKIMVFETSEALLLVRSGPGGLDRQPEI